MTGEVTLRGNVLPIGGLKEKLLAALRGGITKVMIPMENAKDLTEIPDNVKEGLEIIPVSHVSEVLKHALVRQPESIEWDEVAEEAAQAARLAARNDGSGLTAHYSSKPHSFAAPPYTRGRGFFLPAAGPTRHPARAKNTPQKPAPS
jgi:ATP-dependent Lon protease